MPWPIVGHDWAVTLLRDSLEAGRVSHAYLFSGPAQVGKTTLARTLAQALNCRASDPPCGVCSACQRIARGSYPDVQVIVGRGQGGALLIDQVRDLQHDAALAPYEGVRRVFILRHVDRADEPAYNSLLKTLEEPPGKAILLLTAVRPEVLPPTIVSRCQCLNLRPVPLPALEAALCAGGTAAPEARLLARLSAGRVGWALAALNDATVLRQREQDLDQWLELLSADRLGRLGVANAASRDSVAARRQIELWMVWWRDVLLLGAGRQDYLVNTDQMDDLAHYAQALPMSRALQVLKALQRAVEQLDANVSPRLALESLALQLPYFRKQD